MSITPKFQAVSEEALIDNTLAFIASNFKGMLDALYPVEAALSPDDLMYLSDFAERSLGQVLGNETPALGITPIRNASTLSDDGSYLTEALRMDLAVGVVSDGPQNVTRKIMRYMRALEATLRYGQINDFFATVGPQLVFGFSLDCEHVYPQRLWKGQSVYMRDATLQVIVNIHERKILK